MSRLTASVQSQPYAFLPTSSKTSNSGMYWSISPFQRKLHCGGIVLVLDYSACKQSRYAHKQLTLNASILSHRENACRHIKALMAADAAACIIETWVPMSVCAACRDPCEMRETLRRLHIKADTVNVLSDQQMKPLLQIFRNILQCHPARDVSGWWHCPARPSQA